MDLLPGIYQTKIEKKQDNQRASNPLSCPRQRGRQANGINIMKQIKIFYIYRDYSQLEDTTDRINLFLREKKDSVEEIKIEDNWILVIMDDEGHLIQEQKDKIKKDIFLNG